jgi:hypothetical protein
MSDSNSFFKAVSVKGESICIFKTENIDAIECSSDKSGIYTTVHLSTGNTIDLFAASALKHDKETIISAILAGGGKSLTFTGIAVNADEEEDEEEDD